MSRSSPSSETASPADGACIGMDVGGTFTDVVVAGPEGWRLEKVPSRPDRPERPGVEALRRLDPEGRLPALHGSTVATNALLERRGARTALVLTAGFADLLALGRGQRTDLYSLEPRPREGLLDADEGLTLEIDERLDAAGRILRAPDVAELARLVRRVGDLGADAVAVCLLFSWLDDRHERRVALALRQAGLARFLSLSSRVLPAVREVERASTTLANAYLMPLMHRYLDRLARGLAGRPLAVMGSHAGLLAPRAAARLPVATVLSGPAGGVLGARAVASRLGLERVLSLDMGGTSTDVALSDGEPVLDGWSLVGGIAIHRPSLRIHTIGAGGGSIIQVAAGGALRLGPRSAGSRPGPAAYGRGGFEPTLTDANVVLGRLPAGMRLADGTPLDAAAAARSLAPLARRLGLGIADCALAAVRLADVQMERALRHISVEAGVDPRDCSLVAFGGAAGMHACALAEGLAIPRVLVPAAAGLLSAVGLATAPPSASVLRSVAARPWPRAGEAWPAALEAAFRHLHAAALRDLGRLGDAGDLAVHRAADLRYEGQSWDLTLPWDADPRVLRSAFEALHQARFGFHLPERRPQLVALRLTVRGRPLATLPDTWRWTAAPAASPNIDLVLDGGRRQRVPLVPRSLLAPGDTLRGPAVITQPDSTLFLAGGWGLTALPTGDLLLERG